MAKEERGEKTSTRRVVDIPIDPVNEQVLIHAACVSEKARNLLVGRYPADYFLVREHVAAWSGIRELHRRKLDFDPATLQSICGTSVDVKMLMKLIELRGSEPATNIDHHMTMFEWDHTRAVAARGPVAALVEAAANPRETPARVRALARQVGTAFDGQAGEHLLDSDRLIAEQMAIFEQRIAGIVPYSYGIPTLDNDETGERRMIPGAEPGKVTVVTGVSGSGKSTFLGSIILGLARMKRRVCVGAWEMGGGMTLELLAGLSLNLSRTDLQKGLISPEELQLLYKTMKAISRYVVFLQNPYGRRPNEKQSNERNLDLLQNYLGDTGCDVFVADLWERLLVDSSPEEEKRALFRQQAMMEEMHIHGILVCQQRLKDIELRADKRPTREGIKGSGAYIEIADTIMGTHRPALWKQMNDDVLNVFILKQRYGKWPIGIEFDWNAEFGRIENGKSIPYDHPGLRDDTSDGWKVKR